MSILVPNSTTMGDLVAEAIKISGRLGLGQTAKAEDVTLGWAYLQMMLQQWERQRFHVYRIESLSKLSTGAQSYSVGPGGDFDTGTAGIGSVRPAKVTAAFLRQMNTGTVAPDYPMGLLMAKEDYDRIRLKTLSTLSSVVWYDPSWPLGTVYFWPIAPASQYTMFISVLIQLPYQFATTATTVVLPYEYFWAIVTNLAMRLRARWGIKTFAGDTLPGQAKEALSVLKDVTVAIPRLNMPEGMIWQRGSGYNIFSDTYW